VVKGTGILNANMTWRKADSLYEASVLSRIDASPHLPLQQAA